MYIYSIQSDMMHSFHPKHSNLENRCFRYIGPQKSPKILEVDTRFEICREANAVLRKTNTFYFWSDRFETNRTWAPILGLHVLFVSKQSDQNTKVLIFRNTSDFL